ncbi:hypothetical protein AVEN_274808-1, partial [Araneus ventricosus]
SHLRKCRPHPILLDLKNRTGTSRWLTVLANNVLSSARTLDPHEIGLSCSRGSEEYQPFMVVYFKSNDKPRVRRSTKSQKEDRYYDHESYNPYSGLFTFFFSFSWLPY